MSDRVFVFWRHKCHRCQVPLNLDIFGPVEKVDYVEDWVERTTRNPFLLNQVFLKKIDGKMRRVCIDCFEYLFHVKKLSFLIVRDRELGVRKTEPPEKRTAFTDYSFDFWMKSMIHCYKVGL